MAVIPVIESKFKKTQTDLAFAILQALGGTMADVPNKYADTTDDILYAILLAIINGGLGGGGGTAGWSLTGNNPVAGNFLGTTTDERLEIRTGSSGGLTRLFIGDDGVSGNVTLVQISEEFAKLSLGNPIPTSSPCSICSAQEIGISSTDGLSFSTPKYIGIDAGLNMTISAGTYLNQSGQMITLSVSNIPGNTGLVFIGIKHAPSTGLQLLGRDPANGEVKIVNDIPFVQAGNGWEISGNAGNGNSTPMKFGTTTVDDINLIAANIAIGRITKTGKFGLGTTQPESTVHVGGTLGAKHRRVNLDNLTSYSMQDNPAYSYTFKSDMVGNNNTVVYMWPPDSCPDRIVVIRREFEDGANTDIFLDGVAIQNLDMQTTSQNILLSQKVIWTFQSDGVMWMVLSRIEF